MANGGLIGPVKVVCTPSTKVHTYTSSGTFKKKNCTSTIPEVMVVAGGGAGGGPSATNNGGAGGPGVVIARFPGPSSFSVAPGTNTIATLPAPEGGCKVATFTATGTLTIS